VIGSGCRGPGSSSWCGESFATAESISTESIVLGIHPPLIVRRQVADEGRPEHWAAGAD